MRRFREIALVMGVLATSTNARADGEFSLEANFGTSLIAHPHPEDAAAPPVAVKPEFGKKNTWRWMVQGGMGIDTDSTSDNTFGLLGGGVSYFIIDDLSLDLELNGMYFNQIGDDAFGLNFSLMFRWHFVSTDTWSIYVDGGAGLLATTAKVPGPTPFDAGGSSINFTPQGGFGFTVEIAEDVRLLGGMRLHHISNAQMYEGNPGRDSLLIYGGVSFPF